MKIKERAKKLKEDIPAVFMALKNKKTPWYAKIIAAITVAYALSPIDLIPDFIPILGYIDDIIILPLLVLCVIKLIPKDVFAECKEKSKELWKNNKPKKWYFAIPIILFWLIIIYFVIKNCFKAF
ncbi:MAG: YkvA family protein [Oscillospiraceae bacterium]